MRYYETLYIVNPNLENEALDKTMGEISTELEKTKSKLINHRVWGKKRLAYLIQKQKYGSYILLQFEGGDHGQMVEFDTWMKLNTTVLRHMTVVLDEQPEVHVEEVKEEPVKKETVEVTPEVEAKEATEEATEEPVEVEPTEEASDESSEEEPEEKDAE